jgi:hypothetical protein
MATFLLNLHLSAKHLDCLLVYAPEKARLDWHPPRANPTLLVTCVTAIPFPRLARLHPRHARRLWASSCSYSRSPDDLAAGQRKPLTTAPLIGAAGLVTWHRAWMGSGNGFLSRHPSTAIHATTPPSPLPSFLLDPASIVRFGCKHHGTCHLLA